MRLSILGPVEASVADRPIALGGAKQRAVLAMLGLEPNRAISAGRLIEGLWGDEPPASAAKMLQNYVWRLRGQLAIDRSTEIVTRGRGYELRIDPDLVDAHRLERLVAEAARAAASGEPVNGSAREALALFRGDPLADLAGEPFADAEIRRLEELRLTAAELAIASDLAEGRHQELVGEIDGLLAANPLRERLYGQRMLALYRCGRQAEALEAYRRARQTLVDEIGVEPAPELRDLHDAILRQDPSLDLETGAPELPRELEAAASQPMLGRERELRRLQACRRDGALVAVVGAYGMGKTRLAAELAAEAHREGVAILYATGTGRPEAAMDAIVRMRGSRRPVLLVLDDADRAPVDVRAALCSPPPPPRALVLATGQEAAALDRLDPRETIVLEPLDADAVRAIASLYGEAPPVEALQAESRGVALRVHEAAGAWARAKATRRVDAAADRAAAGRNQAAALEAELAGSVVELQSARERSLDRPTSDAPFVCPYKGLATFGADDAGYFFGRERLVAELVARLVGAPLLAVVGPSGSGKSSVVRAGLLPALAGGVLPGSHGWSQALIRPGAHPMHELSRVTRKLSRARRRVLAIDQFEELFTACDDERERRRFASALARIARDGDSVIVLAVRADFYGRCAAYPELSRLLGANHVLVGPMERDDLRNAIERPAERVGLTVEPELVEALLEDVDGEPGALPLLSTTLLELWGGRDERCLRLAAYARSGGVQGAVARLAEDAFIELQPAGRRTARTLLLRLTDEDENGAVVRRRIGLGELEPAAAEVAAQLADRRLLTVGEGAVEVAHEALLREWPRLRGWLDEDVQGRRLHRQLRDAARAWDADAREDGGLYRGARLAAALDWAAEHEPELNRVERAFLDQSRSASGRATRRLRLVIAGMACLLALALGAGVVALSERRNALQESANAAAQRIGARALLDDDVARSMLLARQAVALDDSVHSRSNLLGALLKNPAAIGVIDAGPGPVLTFDLSPDGRTLAAIDDSGELSFIDTASRRRIAPSYPALGQAFEPNVIVDDVRFSPDGTRVAVGGNAPVILDARSHRRLSALYVARDRIVYSLRFSPDGREVFAILGTYSGLTPRMEVQRLDAADGRPLGPPRRVATRLGPMSLMVTSDGRRVVTTGPTSGTTIFGARGLQPLRHLPVNAERAALSPDDRTLLIGGHDGSVRFYDLATGEIRQADGRHASAVAAAAFTRDGRRVVTGALDGRAIVWDVRRAAAIETLAGHSDWIAALAFTGDDSTLYTGSIDGKVLVWDLAGTRGLGRPFRIPEPTLPDGFPATAVSPDGGTLAVADRDGAVKLVDLRTLETRPRRIRIAPGSHTSTLTFLPDGRRLAIGDDDGRVVFADPRTGALATRLPRRGVTVWQLVVSRDGRFMTTLDGDNRVRRWSLPSGRPAGEAFKLPDTSFGGFINPDGRRVGLYASGGIEIVDLATHRRVHAPVQVSRWPTTFTADWRYLLSTDKQGRMVLWSTDSWRRIAPKLEAPMRDLTSIAVSPDGRTLATGSADGTSRLWDLSTGRLVGAPLAGVPSTPALVEFTPDGAFLLVLTPAGKAFRWDVRPSSWADQACRIAGRTLTRAEWSAALPGREYAPAC